MVKTERNIVVDLREFQIRKHAEWLLATGLVLEVMVFTNERREKAHIGYVLREDLVELTLDDIRVRKLNQKFAEFAETPLGVGCEQHIMGPRSAINFKNAFRGNLFTSFVVDP